MTGRISARVLVLACFGLLLSGCLPSRTEMSPAAKRNCMANNARFADAWACIRSALVARDAGDQKRDGLIEEGDLLADQVRDGKVSEADARARLRAGLSHEVGM